MRGTDQIFRFVMALADKAGIPEGLKDRVDWHDVMIREMLVAGLGRGRGTGPREIQALVTLLPPGQVMRVKMSGAPGGADELELWQGEGQIAARAVAGEQAGTLRVSLAEAGSGDVMLLTEMEGEDRGPRVVIYGTKQRYEVVEWGVPGQEGEGGGDATSPSKRTG